MPITTARTDIYIHCDTDGCGSICRVSIMKKRITKESNILFLLHESINNWPEQLPSGWRVLDSIVTCHKCSKPRYRIEHPFIDKLKYYDTKELAIKGFFNTSFMQRDLKGAKGATDAWYYQDVLRLMYKFPHTFTLENMFDYYNSIPNRPNANIIKD